MFSARKFQPSITFRDSPWPWPCDTMNTQPAQRTTFPLAVAALPCGRHNYPCSPPTLAAHKRTSQALCGNRVRGDTSRPAAGRSASCAKSDAVFVEERLRAAPSNEDNAQDRGCRLCRRPPQHGFVASRFMRRGQTERQLRNAAYLQRLTLRIVSGWIARTSAGLARRPPPSASRYRPTTMPTPAGRGHVNRRGTDKVSRGLATVGDRGELSAGHRRRARRRWMRMTSLETSGKGADHDLMPVLERYRTMCPAIRRRTHKLSEAADQDSLRARAAPLGITAPVAPAACRNQTDRRRLAQAPGQRHRQTRRSHDHRRLFTERRAAIAPTSKEEGQRHGLVDQTRTGAKVPLRR